MTNESHPHAPIPGFPFSLGDVLETLDQLHSQTKSWLWGDGPGAQEARTYLMEVRGLSEEVVRDEEIGYIPDSRDGRTVVQWALDRGIDIERLHAAGVVRPYVPDELRDLEGVALSNALAALPDARKRSIYRDYPSFGLKDGSRRADHCLVFPIASDVDDRVLGWQCRTVRADAADRYMSPLLRPFLTGGTTIYGLGRHSALLASGVVVITEGEIDRYAMVDALREEPDPPLVLNLRGAKLLQSQMAIPEDLDEEAVDLQELKTRAGLYAPLAGKTVILAIDEDSVGQSSALSNAALLHAIGCTVRILRPSDVTKMFSGPDAKDVGDVLAIYGRKALLDVYRLGTERSISRFASEMIAERWSRLRGSPLPMDLLQRAEAGDLAVRALASDDIALDEHHVRVLAEVTGIPGSLLESGASARRFGAVPQ